jgi:fido (protein-threonine AMPylation protein)
VPAGLAITCPNWEYATIAGHDQLLRARAKSAFIRLRNVEPPRLRSLLKDTRNVHEQFFRDLTPQDFAYYAGHYRGELYICLKHYEVMIPGDPRVGHPPDKVLQSMANLAPQIDDALQQCKLMWRVPNAVFSPPEKLSRLVGVGAAVFVYFLEIHPYANGNGHIARFLLISFLSCFGIFLKEWLHPRPADPPYSQLISDYRSGNRAPLEQFILRSI